MTNDPPQGPPPTSAPPALQFDRAEAATPPSPASIAGFQPSPTVTGCVVCRRPITDYYFEAGGKIICPNCRQIIASTQTGGSAVGRVFRAMAMGAVAGLAGAAIWYGVRHVTNLELSLIAILVGYMVGSAVRKGSDNRGGVGYQLLAVALTYVAACATFFPDLLSALLHGKHGTDVPVPVHVAIAAVGSLALPFLLGAKNFIGLVIIGFGLWQAWRMNQRRPIVFNGPYRINPDHAAQAPVAGFTPPVTFYQGPYPAAPATAPPPAPPPWPPAPPGAA